jgi:hypothetical protein
MAMEGLFDLKTPEHPLHKLEWEYTQWQDDPLNTYRAWNFFVTAEHLPDWLWHTDSRPLKGVKPPAFRKQCSLLRICPHLANGGKHFRPNREYTSVASTRQQKGWVPSGWMPPVWVELPALMVDLSPKEQQELPCPSASIDAFGLAEEVLAFWQERLGLHPRPSGTPRHDPC